MNTYVGYVADRALRKRRLIDPWTRALRIVRVDLWPGRAAEYERGGMVTRIARLEAGPTMSRMWCRLMVLVDSEPAMVFRMIVIAVEVHVRRRDCPGS